LGSKLFPTLVTLEGSSMDSGAVLMSESSSWMDTLDVLALGMIRSGRGGGGDSAMAFFNS
jgi:hypothetical protein